jgi:acetoin utilization protein AcuB
MVSDRDLRDASPALGDPQQASVLQEMYELKIESLPVVAEASVIDEGSAVGEEELLRIVTSSDVTRALVTLAGLPEPGCRIEVQPPDRAGTPAEAAGRIHDLGVDIVIILSDPNRRSANRTLVFQLVLPGPSDVMQNLKTAGYEVSWIA